MLARTVAASPTPLNWDWDPRIAAVKLGHKVSEEEHVLDVPAFLRRPA